MSVCVSVCVSPGGQTFSKHSWGGQTFLTHWREGGQTFLHRAFVGGGGGYNDVDEKMDVSKANVVVS